MTIRTRMERPNPNEQGLRSGTECRFTQLFIGEPLHDYWRSSHYGELRKQGLLPPSVHA